MDSDAFDDLDVVEVIDPTKHNSVGVSLQVEERLEFRLQLISFSIDTEGLELLAYDLFN
jgi:hypothetical protein